MQKSGLEINQLVSKARQGDSKAFGQLYDNFAQRIFKYVRLKIQNREEAEDILQEVFVKAYRGLNSLNPENLNFNAWLYKVASNTVNDHFRKIYRAPEIVGIDEDFDTPDFNTPEKEITIKSDLETAQEAFTQLPVVYKQVLELRFLQDMSLTETAKILNKSNLSIRLIQYRALKRVKLILREKYGSEYGKI
jgi:RNA polymerase sigma-70 factor (ECF subfamily)